MDIYGHYVNSEQNIENQWKFELTCLLKHTVLNENSAISLIAD